MVNQYLFKIRKKYFIFTPKFQIFDVSDTLTGPDGGDEGGRKEGRKESNEEGKEGKVVPVSESKTTDIWDEMMPYVIRGDS